MNRRISEGANRNKIASGYDMLMFVDLYDNIDICWICFNENIYPQSNIFRICFRESAKCKMTAQSEGTFNASGKH